MTISKIGNVFFTAVTTVNGVTRERSEYLGGANVQNPPIYACYTNNDRTVGNQFYFFNVTGQTNNFGFSTRVNVPSTFAGTTFGTAMYPTNNFIAFTSSDTPGRLKLLKLTGGTSPFAGLLTTPTNIDTDISGTGYWLRFNPQGTVLTIPYVQPSGTNCFKSYNVSGATSDPPLGTILTNPGSFPTSNTRCLCCGWHPNGNYLAVGATTTATDGIAIYPVSGSPLAYGTKISVSSAGDFRTVIFSPKGDMLLAATTDTNSPVATIQIYPWNNGSVGTRYTNPTTFVTAHSIAMSSDQKYVMIGLAASTYLRAYNWSGSTTSDYGYGSEITITITKPNSTVRNLKWFGVNDRYIIIAAGASSTGARAGIYVWGANGASGNIAYSLASTVTPTNDVQDCTHSWQ